MVLQTLNIASGFLISSRYVASLGAKEFIENIHQKILPYKNIIGVLTLLLGLIGLIERLGIISLNIPYLGESLIQAPPAILLGLLLSRERLEHISVLQELIQKLVLFQSWIGLCGMFVGIWSLLFGCNVYPICAIHPF
jgi:hypothetical protein